MMVPGLKYLYYKGDYWPEEVKTIEYIGEDRRVMFHYFMLKKIEGKFLISQDHSDRMWATKGEIEEMDLHPSVALYFDL